MLDLVSDNFHWLTPIKAPITAYFRMLFRKMKFDGGRKNCNFVNYYAEKRDEEDYFLYRMDIYPAVHDHDIRMWFQWSAS